MNGLCNLISHKHFMFAFSTITHVYQLMMISFRLVKKILNKTSDFFFGVFVQAKYMYGMQMWRLRNVTNPQKFH